MSSIEAQVTELIAEAPADADTQFGIRVIAPLLGQIAEQFESPQYYILQNLEQQWQLTTLQNRHQPELEKTVVYAYRQLSDATQAGRADNLIAVPLPTVHLLFHFLTISQVDSFLFVNSVATDESPVELSHGNLQLFIQEHLQQMMQDSTDSTIA
jgi:hypothetical protein